MKEEALICVFASTRLLLQPPSLPNPLPPLQGALGLPAKGRSQVFGDQMQLRNFSCFFEASVLSCRRRGGENRGRNSLPCAPDPRPETFLKLAVYARVCRWGGRRSVYQGLPFALTPHQGCPQPRSRRWPGPGSTARVLHGSSWGFYGREL